MSTRRCFVRFLSAIGLSLFGALAIGEFKLIDLSAAALPPPLAAAPAGFFAGAPPMARAESVGETASSSSGEHCGGLSGIECTPCGGAGQRACTITERIPSCNSGLVEIAGCSGNCHGPIFDSSGTCIAVSPCGGEGQRACTITERIPSCNGGLVEIPGCTGDCRGPQFTSSGMCTAVSPCGGKGQRACTITERIPSCNAGLVEIPGCSGDCWGNGAKSLGMCTVVENIPEPDINGSAFSVDQCSLDGYMDMHMHQFAHMAHGGGVLAGTPYSAGGVNDALKPDFSTPVDLVNGDGTPLGTWDEGVAASQTDGNPLAETLRDLQNFAGNLMNFLLDCPSELYGGKCNDNVFHGFHDPLIGDSVGSFIGTKDGAGFSNMGAPLFNGWPKWTSTTHQQVYHKWLERAWRGGLRMMTELAVTNEALCRGSKHINPTQCRADAALNGGSMTSIDQQIQAAKDFQTYIDNLNGGPGKGWYRIVTTPMQARAVIAQGKLAVSLGIETAELFNCYENGTCTETFVNNKVDEYYNKGVRVVFPIHNFDNGFGAAATWQDGIEVGQRLVEGRWWETRNCNNEGYGFKLGGFTQLLITLLKFSRDINIATYPDRPEDASCNNKGMLPLGDVLMNKLMSKGMIIDVDHMSALSFDRAMQLAENFSRNGVNKYPGIAASHVLSFELHKQSVDGEGTRHERLRTPLQLQRIKNVGGIVAAMLKDDAQDTGNKAKKLTVGYSPLNGGVVADNCRHSSRTFAHAYQYLVDQMGGPVALGSDFNGVAGHIGPRFGVEACGGVEKPETIAERNEQLRAGNRVGYPFTIPGFGTFDRQKTGHRTFDYNYDGMAHVGLLPDFVEDLKKVGMNQYYVDNLFGSAEAYIKMWEGATRSTIDTTDDTPAEAVSNICTFLSDPDVSITGPDQVDEGVTASYTISVRKGWNVVASCGPVARVHAETFALTDTSGSVSDKYTVTCAWRGGDWGGPQTGQVFYQARRENQAPAFVKSVTVVNRAPGISGLVGGTAETGKLMTRSFSLTDAPAENLTVDVVWGDGQTTSNLPAAPGGFNISHGYKNAGTFALKVTVRDEALSTSQTVNVIVSGAPDTEKPTIQVPADMTVPQDTPQGAFVSFVATAMDGHAGPLPVTCDPPSGSGFLTGDTTVNCFAVDPSGNRADGSFKVTVVPGGRVAVVVPQFAEPVNRWRLDEGGGIRGLDTAQVGFPSHAFLGYFGQFQPQPWETRTTCAGPAGSLLFNNSSIVSLGPAGPYGTQDFTESLWFKTTASTGTLLSNGNSLNGNSNSAVRGRFQLRLRDGSLEILLERGDTDVSVEEFSVWGGQIVNDGKWHHAAVVREGDWFTLMVDGQVDYERQTGDEWDLIQNTSNSTWHWLGGMPPTSGLTAQNLFVGSIGDVQRFDRALDEGEIEAIADSLVDSNNDGTCNVVLRDLGRQASSSQGRAVSFNVFAYDSITNLERAVSCKRPDGTVAVSGAIYPIGYTRVTCSSLSISNVESKESFNIFVDAGNIPFLTMPDDITRNATTVNGTPVSFSVTASDPQDGPLTPVCSHNSGATFPVGTTVVSCSVKDRQENSASDSFSITVIDLPPVILFRGPMIVEATGPNGATVAYQPPAAHDDVDGSLTPTCAPASNQVFPLGTTPVKCDAKDSRQQPAAPFTFTVTVRDTTPPVVTPAVAPAANAAGWHNVSPTIQWTATDLVGVTLKIACDPQTIASETGGAVLNCFAFDAAGNMGVGQVALKIDKTAPIVSFQAPAPAANANGWRNSDTFVAYSAADALSGLAAGTPSGGLLSFTTDGQGLTRSVTASDVAGNTRTATTEPIDLDKTAPAISVARAPLANANGWNNTDVAANFTCSDGLSGLEFCTPSQNLGDEGAGQSRDGLARDRAGNTATASVGNINIDKTAPTIAGSPDRPANANNWYNAGVTVSYLCGDALSGVLSCSQPTALPGEGAAQSAAGSVMDLAGNEASTTVGPIHIDMTAPTIVGSLASAPNANNWFNTNVTVNFTCADALSGIGACGPSQVVSEEGANLSRTGTAADLAGNSASASVTGINLDKTPPVVQCSTNTPSLWPPNHRMVGIQTAVGVIDALSPAAGFKLVGATSNEPDNGLGDGDTANDIQGFTIGTADTAGQLRAERSGKGTGRIYSLRYQSIDLAGNSGVCTSTTTVPHDQSKTK